MFVLHPLWQQLMETVLLWTQCHRQMDPLGLCINHIHFKYICCYYASLPISTQAQSVEE